MNRAVRLCAQERVAEELLHCHVMEKDATEDSKMPDIVAATHIVKHAREPALGDLSCIEDGTAEIYQDALGDGSVKIHCISKPVRHAELEEGQKTGGS